MIAINKSPLRVILELSDNEGYTPKELSNNTGTELTYISKCINKFLLKNSLVYVRKEPIKKKNRGLKGVGDFYYIGPDPSASPDEKLDIFKIILESSVGKLKPELLKRLLASKYVDSLIKECGLISFYNAIKEYMERVEFQKIASEALLGQQAFIDEYKKLPSMIKDQIYANSNFILSDSDCEKYLEFLIGLNEVNSIEFYRKYLAKPFAGIYIDATSDILKKLEPFDLITEGLKEFVEVDIYLNPISSFPIHRPSSLLLIRPFERLYNDFFIFSKEDIKRFVLRAHIIYKNFTEVASSGMYHETIHLYDIKKYLPLYLLSWNQSVCAIDNLYRVLKKLDFSPDDSGDSFQKRYHIYSDITGFKIKKLNDNSLIFNEENERTVSSFINLRYNPWKELHSCYCFEELGLKTENKSYEKILSEITLLLEEKCR